MGGGRRSAPDPTPLTRLGGSGRLRAGSRSTMPEEAPVTSAVPLVEVVMSVLRFASRWLEPVGRPVTYALPQQEPIGRNWNPSFHVAERTRDGSPRRHVDRARGR